MKLLLASKSPRRRQLLESLGLPVRFIDIDVDEHDVPAMSACELPEYLACRKADAVDRAALEPDEVVVAADTVVALRGQALGKPADRTEAVAMLHALSDSCHTVYTGVCLQSISQRQSFTEATDVFFRRLTDDEVDYYVDRFQPFDKAGSYGIQEWIGMIGVRRIEGCFYNVMGLPVSSLYERLSRMSASI